MEVKRTQAKESADLLFQRAAQSAINSGIMIVVLSAAALFFAYLLKDIVGSAVAVFVATATVLMILQNNSGESSAEAHKGINAFVYYSVLLFVVFLIPASYELNLYLASTFHWTPYVSPHASDEGFWNAIMLAIAIS